MVQPLPTQRGLTIGRLRIVDVQRPGFGLDLLLDLAAEAVGVGEAELDLRPCWRQQIADVGFAGEVAAQAAATSSGRRGWPAACGGSGRGRRRCAWWRSLEGHVRPGSRRSRAGLAALEGASRKLVELALREVG